MMDEAGPQDMRWNPFEESHSQVAASLAPQQESRNTSSGYPLDQLKTRRTVRPPVRSRGATTTQARIHWVEPESPTRTRRGGYLSDVMAEAEEAQVVDLAQERRDGLLPDTPPGAIFCVTEDVHLVYGLRGLLLDEPYEIIWGNHFWSALSRMNEDLFVSLVLDLSMHTIEPHLLISFIEEYEKQSSGEVVFLAGRRTPQMLVRMLKRRGYAVLEDDREAMSLLSALAGEKPDA